MVERTATIESGWDALVRGDWKRARKLFAAAGENAEVLEGLGLAAWWLDEEAALDARERAYRLYRERGDARAAGGIATWLALALREVQSRPPPRRRCAPASSRRSRRSARAAGGYRLENTFVYVVAGG